MGPRGHAVNVFPMVLEVAPSAVTWSVPPGSVSWQVSFVSVSVLELSRGGVRPARVALFGAVPGNRPNRKSVKMMSIPAVCGRHLGSLAGVRDVLPREQRSLWALAYPA